MFLNATNRKHMKIKAIRRVTLLAILVCFLSCTTKNNVDLAIPKNEKIEQQIEDILKRMTLEEKIGQMTELTINTIGACDSENNFEISDALLDTVIGKYKVGSILNTPNALTPTKEQWQSYITKIQEKSISKLGIPCIYGLDQNHGTTYTQGGTLFPQNINMAAAFNRENTRRAAEITAYETRACSVPWTYSPTLDLGRDSRWPRIWENYGEDCYLNGEMGKSAVLGFQGEDPNHIDQNHIAVSLKHYMGYGTPVSGKDRTPASITLQDLREKHFAPYLAAIRSGALTVMVNSGSNNGLPFHANYEMLTQWLKKDLNWDGMIVTDWADINNLYTRDKIAIDKKDAIRIAINAGIDMAMEPYSCDFCVLLKELVNEGKVPMSRIDDAVRRVLRLKLRLGLFNNPIQNTSNYPLFACKNHSDFALHSAEESMILLKNLNKTLPLTFGTKILVTGPNANSMRCLNGGWSYSWQGDAADKYATEHNTIFEALCNKFGGQNVILEQGVTYNDKGKYWEENEPNIDKAVAATAKVDVVVACIGENSYCETPGNLTDLTLSRNQLNLVEALSKTGKPIILILNEGRPRIINEIEPLASAIVDILLPGNFGGDALSNLLAGEVNFSGKLPYTYPKEVHSLITYDYKPCQEVDKMEGAYDYDAVVSVQWAFGYGQSYTTFSYSNLRVDKQSFTANDILTFTVDVTNNGTYAGKESVLLFSRDLVASLTPDIRRLRAFDKVELQQGETKSVSLQIKGSDLAFVGYDGKWILEQGDFLVQIGDQTVNVTCRETYKWESPIIGEATL